MVSEKKKQVVKQVQKQMEEYPVVGILDMHKLPGRQLHEIRNKLRGKAVMRMVKKRLILRILKDKGLSNLEQYVGGEPALFMTKENPFKMARILQSSKSEAPAKIGDIAPKDILIKAGPTSLSPGPVIGEFQKVKVPAGVEGEKIVIKKDTIIAKQGDVITEGIANILSKLSIQPMEIGLNLLAVQESGIVYDKEVLFVPQEQYANQLSSAISHAFNLSIYINYFTKENIALLLGKAHREGESLAMQANIITPSTIQSLLAQSSAQAKAVEKKV